MKEENLIRHFSLVDPTLYLEQRMFLNELNLKKNFSDNHKRKKSSLFEKETGSVWVVSECHSEEKPTFGG